MNDFGRLLMAFVGMAFALATVSVVLSAKAETPTLIEDTTGGLAEIIQAADSPVTGGGSVQSGFTSGNPFGTGANLLNEFGVTP